jgi:hypothetical protein
MIIPWNDLDIAKIQLHHPECHGIQRFKMRCEYNNVDCFIQVPLSTIYKCDKKMSVGFPYFAEQKDKASYIRKMEEIDKWMSGQFTDLWKTINPSTKKRKKTPIQWTPMIRKNQHTAYMSFSIQMERIRNQQGKIIVKPIIDVYDRQKKRLGGIEAIEVFSYAYHIIHMDSIWISLDEENGRWNAGLQWSVVQTRMYPSVFRISECMIREDTTDFPDTVDHKPTLTLPQKKEDHPVFGRYFKMQRMGIPEGAIEHKLRQDGLTIEEFRVFMNDGTVPSTKPKMNALFASINSGGFSLKKAEKKEIIPIQVKDKFTPPSKDELQNLISKLKKVN